MSDPTSMPMLDGPLSGLSKREVFKRLRAGQMALEEFGRWCCMLQDSARSGVELRDPPAVAKVMHRIGGDTGHGTDVWSIGGVHFVLFEDFEKATRQVRRATGEPSNE